MSKMQRKPRVEHDGVKYESNDGGVTYTPVGGLPNAVVLPEEAATAPLGIDKSLAKVMTNEETPRCPFCNSVKLTEMPYENWLRFRCDDCRKHFRQPAKGRAA